MPRWAAATGGAVAAVLAVLVGLMAGYGWLYLLRGLGWFSGGPGIGDVLPLLRDPDDMYVIMGPGDETTIEFDASSASSLPPGWKRDFLLYTDGWIKDSDLNTAFGTTVGPLPFHEVKAYPYGRGDAYPADQQHTRYLSEFNTRVVRRILSPP